MDANTIAWLGVSATIVSGAISGYISRTDAFDRLLSRHKGAILSGTTWESRWDDTNPDGTSSPRSESFIFTKQVKNRVFGYITMHDYPDRKWIIEGDYNDRFLRLFWTPSADSNDRFFLDYGTYFFERGGDGIFNGYAVGFDAETNDVVAAKHTLKLLRTN